jgi:hypothetical protein
MKSSGGREIRRSEIELCRGRREGEGRDVLCDFPRYFEAVLPSVEQQGRKEKGEKRVDEIGVIGVEGGKERERGGQ